MVLYSFIFEKGEKVPSRELPIELRNLGGLEVSILYKNTC